MKIGIIGSSTVAQTNAQKLLELGHEVMISSRNPTQEKNTPMGKVPSVTTWVSAQKAKSLKALGGSFKDAAQFGEVIFNCTAGVGSLVALTSAGAENITGKILVDIANPLDFSKGFPPTLAFCNTQSLGEKIQAAFPESKVVKTLHTVNADIMVNPTRLSENTTIFVASNHTDAKNWVKTELLEKWYGWKEVIDLGDITAARGTEMYLPLWLRIMGAVKTPYFNIKVVAGK